MKRSSRPSSRLSLLPVPALSRGLLRPTTHDEAETRTKEREEIERCVRQELAADMKNLEAKMELEKKERELELAKEAAMMREKELQETLEAERALLRQRQKEAEEQMQKEQEEMWKRAQEEMEARIARAVEEEVAKRLEAINMKSAESSKVEQGVAGPSRTVTPSTSGTLEPPPAYDPDSEVKRRLDALEQRYALQNSDQALTRALSPRSKKKQAHAYLELAREYHLEKEDYENALYFYKRAQQYVPDNAKLKVRIEEMQLAIESKNKGLPFGGVKRTRAAASRHQALPEYLSAENDDNDDDNDAETNGDDATDVFLANRARPADRTRSKVKKQRETVLQEGSKANEGGDEAMDIEVKLECGVEGSPEKPARKKRLVSISKGKNRWDLGESSEEENEPDLVEEKVRGAARRKGKKARKGRV
ncbi:hypothetical protein FRB99_000653 [Tulasnella sp. 403]|nr:hypothetical protein FRB99_000653 [Tulasnella sp. 403]